MPGFVSPVVPAGRLSSVSQPDLVVGELMLRPWVAADALAVVEAYRDPGIQWWHARSRSEPEALAWVLPWADRRAAETGVGWAITSDGVLAGRMDVRCFDLDAGQGGGGVLGGSAGQRSQRRAASLTAVIDWPCIEIGFHRVELQHSVHNHPSCRVAAEAHFPQESTKRSSVLHVDGWHDMDLHAIFNSFRGDSSR